jgi:transcriptional regulator with XRE-family HTH domain
MHAESFRCRFSPLLLGGDITSMLTHAVAIYLRELREGRGFTQESLATAIDVGKRTVERLERSEGDISAEAFERIIMRLGASPEEVNYLATNPSATVEEGKELAQLLLQREPAPRPGAPYAAARRQDVGSDGIRAYIRALREHQGIGRKALAEGMGIRMGTLADWEDGRTSSIPAAALVRAVTYLGATVDDLDRITSASSDHEVIGQQLAEARISGATPLRKNTGQHNVHSCR